MIVVSLLASGIAEYRFHRGLDIINETGLQCSYLRTSPHACLHSLQKDCVPGYLTARLSIKAMALRGALLWLK